MSLRLQGEIPRRALAGDILLVIHDFQARSPDELSLTKGDRIELLEKDDDFGDGWYLGKLLSTGLSGLFPEVYTTVVPRASNLQTLLTNGNSASAHSTRPEPGIAPPPSYAHGNAVVEDRFSLTQGQSAQSYAQSYQDEISPRTQDFGGDRSATPTSPQMSNISETESARVAPLNTASSPQRVASVPNASYVSSMAGNAPAQRSISMVMQTGHNREDSPVINETLNVIDEHITDMNTPRSSMVRRASHAHDSGSEYSSNMDARASYVHGDESDEDERVAFSEEEVSKWNAIQVARYLESIGVDRKHCDVFKEQEISGDILLGLDQASVFMKEFDLGVVGRRLRTWHKIRAFQEEVRSNRDLNSRDGDFYDEPFAAGSQGSGARLPKIPLLVNRSATTATAPVGHRRQESPYARPASHLDRGDVGGIFRQTPTESPTSIRSPGAPPYEPRQGSRRHSSIDHKPVLSPFSPSAFDPGPPSVGSAVGPHKKQPSLDRDWSLANATATAAAAAATAAMGPVTTTPTPIAAVSVPADLPPSHPLPPVAAAGTATVTDSPAATATAAAAVVTAADTAADTVAAEVVPTNPAADAAPAPVGATSGPTAAKAIDNLSVDTPKQGTLTPRSEHQLSIDDEKADELDRGYMSGGELDSRKLRNVLRKRDGSSAGHSRQSSYKDESVNLSVSKRHSRFGSAGSFRDAIHSMTGRARAQSNKDASPAIGISSKDVGPPLVTRLEYPTKEESPTLTSSAAKTSSEAAYSTDKTPVGSPSLTSPVGDSISSSPRTSTAASGKAVSVDSNDSSQKKSGKGNKTPTRPKHKTKTSAYTRGLRKVSPKEALSDCDYSGWMKKKSPGLLAIWRPRLFVLQGRRLAYYYSEDDTEEKGLIDISSHRVLPAENEFLAGVHATATRAASIPTSPPNATIQTKNAAEWADQADNSVPNSPKSPKVGSGDGGMFIFKLVPPRAGLSRAVQFTKPAVHYFATDNVKLGRLWMAALMKATIDRDDSKPVTSTYQNKTISLAKAKAMRQRPPALMGVDEEAIRAEIERIERERQKSAKEMRSPQPIQESTESTDPPPTTPAGLNIEGVDFKPESLMPAVSTGAESQTRPEDKPSLRIVSNTSNGISHGDLRANDQSTVGEGSLVGQETKN